MDAQSDKKAIIEFLTHDLKGVSSDYIIELLNKTTWRTTARILGFEIKKYEHLQLAGRMLIYELEHTLTHSIDAYLRRIQYLLNPEIVAFMKNHSQQLDDMIEKRQDNYTTYDWFSANSLVKTYLTKVHNDFIIKGEAYYSSEDGHVCETPLQLWLRISVALYWKTGLPAIKEVFNQLCDGYYIPASPTIFNAGMGRAQMSSCFLLAVEDSLDSIYDKLKEQATISKNHGAVGVDLSRLRHSKIGPHGSSDGLIPWVQLYNQSTRAVNQGSKRKGATTLFCRPHHIDIFEFCEVSLKNGDIYSRAHDINTAIWFPWLFWKRLQDDAQWSMFCPAETPKLNDIYGIEWMKQYIAYENDPTVRRKTVKALDLMMHIIDIQRKTGMPYILHGDAMNMKSNQKNLGYLRSSNLCLEICEYSSETETPSCNLSSISLRAFVKKPYNHKNGYGAGHGENEVGDKDREKNIVAELRKCYDFNKLGYITARVTTNLNQVIEENRYMNDNIKRSNELHRPIGIGVSGFAETLHELDLPFQDEQNDVHPVTRILNKMIFACMYWNALASSVELAIERGHYTSFETSPIAQGEFQFDLWKQEYEMLKKHDLIDDRYRKKEDDNEIEPKTWGQKHVILSNNHTIKPTWDDLRKKIQAHGLRNSLFIALMPTATSAQPLRNCETVEAHQSHIYSRKVMKGAYPVVNRYLVADLDSIGLWTSDTIGLIQATKGSISMLSNFVLSNLNKYPDFKLENKSRLEWICQKYRTMWELSMRIFLQMAADRGRYVCQSQSTNIYLADPSNEQLIAVHAYAQAIGLKTGMYYLRSLAAMDPIKITVDPEIIKYVNSTGMNHDVKKETENKDKEIYSLKKSTKIVCNDEVCMACT